MKDSLICSGYGTFGAAPGPSRYRFAACDTGSIARLALFELAAAMSRLFRVTSTAGWPLLCSVSYRVLAAEIAEFRAVMAASEPAGGFLVRPPAPFASGDRTLYMRLSDPREFGLRGDTMSNVSLL